MLYEWVKKTRCFKLLRGIGKRDDGLTKSCDISDYLDRYRPSFERRGFSVSLEAHDIHISGNDLHIFGQSPNTLWTAEDVLCKGDYEFDCRENFVMIDIGLNIGITSLSMARHNNVTKIYGYEPFAPTFAQALRNFEANPVLSRKIEAFCYGLGDNDETLKINYNPSLPGAMSSVRNAFPEYENIETIQIRKASDVLADIIFQHEERKFLKVDCEGAEYKIFEDLNSANLLQEISVIILEWHYNNPDNLIAVLIRNGFVVFNAEIVSNNLGIIRAVNTK